jgi:phosphate transport system substrate-binding protein
MIESKRVWGQLAAGVLLVAGLAGCTVVSPEQRQAEREHLQRLDHMMKQQDRALEIIADMAAKNQATAAAPVKPLPAEAAAVVEEKGGVAPVSSLSGRIRSVGSDTIDQVMDYWMSEFALLYPNVSHYHQGRGSSTAIPALVEGKAELGPMSRKIKSSEVEHFSKKFGYEPVALRVAVDAVGVYVHPDNPFAKQGMTFKQLDALFSKSCLRGGKAVKTWGDLGLVGSWADAPIHVYSRNSASGTYAFFKETVLTKKGEYRDDMTMLTGSTELVASIAKDRYGIGYSGIGYLNDTVAAVALSEESPTNVFPPEMQYAYSGEYPLSRFLYVAVNKDPAKPLDPAVRAFVDYLYSEKGQEKVAKDGFFPVSNKIIREDKAKLGL